MKNLTSWNKDLVQNCYSSKTVRKTSTFQFHNILLSQIKQSYQSSSKQQGKRSIAQNLSGNVLQSGVQVQVCRLKNMWDLRSKLTKKKAKEIP